MGEWRTTRIGEVAAIFDGPHATPKTVDRGPVYLGIDSLAGGRLKLNDTRHVSEEDYRKWTRRITPRSDDVVFSYETRIGEAAIIPKGLRCCLGRRMGLVRADPSKLDPKFFLYQYLSPKFQAFLRSRTVHGSTVDRLLLTEFPDFEIRLPALDEQRAIAAILGALDNKIELNQQINETLEALVRTIFKSWFVDFDPVRTKAEGSKPFGMDDVTAAAFPDRFASDGLPEGWREVSVSEIAGVNAWTLRSSDELDPIQYIEISSVDRGQINEITSYRRGEEPSRARRRLRHGDTALSTVRPERRAYRFRSRDTESSAVEFRPRGPHHARGV
jgi:type I restriction enzyme, S subunit